MAFKIPYSSYLVRTVLRIILLCHLSDSFDLVLTPRSSVLHSRKGIKFYGYLPALEPVILGEKEKRAIIVRIPRMFYTISILFLFSLITLLSLLALHLSRLRASMIAGYSQAKFHLWCRFSSEPIYASYFRCSPWYRLLVVKQIQKVPTMECSLYGEYA
ncbi:hypothetical protein BT96DRAFT_605384 [Gymnopus androsaceus JB14]|uniref:Uncharacterized protein n=1 Tax=Gymnopus androsaceus JB14 TaxID=1447944 RepID=A0A6A4GIT8_9AGAR|nr:hypothetical protein BT96DRAFT_605384 [Gymnopus androsaceus JB14]